jgi:hypothetical protein
LEPVRLKAGTAQNKSKSEMLFDAALPRLPMKGFSYELHAVCPFDPSTLALHLFEK